LTVIKTGSVFNGTVYSLLFRRLFANDQPVRQTQCSALAQANAALIGESPVENGSCSVARRLFERNPPRAGSTRGFARSHCSAQHDHPPSCGSTGAIVGSLESKIVAAMQQERRETAGIINVMSACGWNGSWPSRVTALFSRRRCEWNKDQCGAGHWGGLRSSW
jgi:hypothetical protein